ncbi:MAG: energy transducer TonB [Thiobacillaceae bacterium]
MTVFTAAVVWMVMGFINGSGKPERPKVQMISLVKPPPPKPPEEKPPEPEKIEKPRDEVKLDQPQPQPQPDAPPPPAGGIPDGPAGGMATDLAAGSGVGGGTANNERRDWYSRMISRQLEDDLKRAKTLQGKDYRIVAQLWFNASGAVSRVQLDKSTGDNGLDEALRQEILRVSLRDPLPDDIPQPVRLRVVSR